MTGNSALAASDTPLKPTWATQDAQHHLVLTPRGSWTLRDITSNPPTPLAARARGTSESIALDGRTLASLDTAGAKLLLDHLSVAGIALELVCLDHFQAQHQKVLELVRNRILTAGPSTLSKRPNTALRAADWLIHRANSVVGHLGFFGEVVTNVAATCLHPRLFRPADFIIQLERAALHAVPIVCLVTCLIGLVMAYLFASQADKVGATIFVVDAVSIGICRELSPVLTAIIVAGRSGSAFTAQLGTMKMSQEIDAIRVMGLSPLQVLVLPRIFALTLAMPLLVFAGDVFGILGGFFISNTSLEISWVTFTSRLQGALQLRHVYIGLAKAPIFAIVVALISCRLGLTVEDNARSVGINTTATVVQSVVTVILLDAMFAIILQNMGW